MPSHFYLQSVLCWKAYSTKPRFCDSSLLRTVYFLPPGRVHRKLETTVSMETKDSLGPCSTICFFIILYIYIYIYQFSSVQLLSCVRLFVIPWTAARQASMSISNSQSLLKLMSIKSVMPSNRLILCHPLLLPPSIFPTIRVFQMSQLFASGGQSIGVSASTSVFPMNIHDWFLLGWTGWISLQSKGLSRVFSSTSVQKHQFFCAQLSL